MKIRLPPPARPAYARAAGRGLQGRVPWCGGADGERTEHGSKGAGYGGRQGVGLW